MSGGAPRPCKGRSARAPGLALTSSRARPRSARLALLGLCDVALVGLRRGARMRRPLMALGWPRAPVRAALRPVGLGRVPLLLFVSCAVRRAAAAGERGAMETLGAMEEHQRDWPRCTGVGADQRTADDCWFVMPRPTGAEDKDLCLTPDGENKAPSWRAMAGQKHVAVVLDKYWAGDGYLSQDLATTAAAIVLQERMGYEVVVKRHAVYGPGSPNADGKVRHRIAKGATHFVAEHWPLADIMHHKWPYPENAAENLTVGFNIYVGLAVKRAFHGDAEPLRASDFAKSFVARRYKASAEAEQAYAGFSGCPSVVGWCTPENGTESLRHYVPPMCEEDPDSCGDAIIEDPRYAAEQATSTPCSLESRDDGTLICPPPSSSRT